jgi:hypothetical protein
LLSSRGAELHRGVFDFATASAEGDSGNDSNDKNALHDVSPVDG